MSRTPKSTTLYPHPFSKAYWSDAAAELKDVKTLVVSALLIALRIALKPLAIPLGPQLSIQTAMLATALGAMIFGPVVAVPAAIISDTIGFILWPTGDYFLPFVLTEIASTMIYALFLYRAKPTATRVMLARFAICFVVNIVLQQFIMAWQYTYMGNPEKAKDTVLGIMTAARIFKNVFFFPIETVVLTLFLKLMLPITQRVHLTYCAESDMKFAPKQIIAMVLLVVVGIGSAIGYLSYRYENNSRSADYTTEERVAANKEVTERVALDLQGFDGETVICIVDSAYRPLFGKQTEYTVSVYILNKENFATGQAKDDKYTMDTLWAYSKSGPSKDKYGSLDKIATATMTKNEETGTIVSVEIQYLK